MSHRLRRQLRRGTSRVTLRLPATVLIFIVSLNCHVFARTEVRLVGPEVPQRYYVGTNFIFHLSDSLYLNDSLLVRDRDYSFDRGRGAFDLGQLDIGPGDTLTISYREVPAWLRRSYGTPLPEVSSAAATPEPVPTAPRRARLQPHGGDVSISGAKTFRFTTGSTGTSTFSQSLDMTLSGKLAPGLELTGAISDRGYDPSYGTANSRLNELEKINLSLSSQVFRAQVGDIFYDEPGVTPASSFKRITGAAIEVSPRGGTLTAVAARPKGRFETVRFFGRDNTQGPYQVAQGSSAAPVVPGSETVWLDGVQLQHGANNDYTMDYPAGRITFNVNHPIDSRSRIEIDYEPLLTSYRGELYSTGGSVYLRDSTIMLDVGWLREGDDRDEPLTGELTESQLAILESAGDNIVSAVQSGVREDTLGAYDLVADSLPDSVYQFVGEGAGDYSVSFSYVGRGSGDYVFLGGSQYVYSGAGRGDYLPIVKIPVPERTDYYRTSVALRDVVLTEFDIEFRQSQFDRNLYSGRDDGDNGGSYYRLSAVERWRLNDAESRIALKARKKQARFETRQRLYEPDFNRAYFLPAGFVPTNDETLYDLGASLGISKSVTVAPFFSRLDYSGELNSRNGGANVAYDRDGRQRLALGWTSIKTDWNAPGTDGSGLADRFRADGIQTLGSRVRLVAGYEFDARKNDYSGILRGTRYHQGRVSLDGVTERVDYELYIEDTLTARWVQQLRRNRVSGFSGRRLGDLGYTLLVTYQWLSASDFDENSVLSRASFDYHSRQRKVDVTAAYAISEEARNSRGISYIEVARGEGDYILENGEYIADPDGNYIRVEEILSEVSRVRRGEKSFHLSKTWPIALIRLNSRIEEELMPDGERELWWVLPMLSDSRQPYLFYSRQYDGDFRLFPIASGHALNFNYSESREMRRVADLPRERTDYSMSVRLKQAAGRAFFEQSGEIFKSDRASYFTSAGIVDGYKLETLYRQVFGVNEFSSGLQYRDAESDLQQRSQIVSATLGSRTQLVRRGELRSSVELYRQYLSDGGLTPSFILTGNRPGERGVVWSLSLRYGIKGGMRVNFSLTGRHADNRSARVTGRGEFVTEF